MRIPIVLLAVLATVIGPGTELATAKPAVRPRGHHATTDLERALTAASVRAARAQPFVLPFCVPIPPDFVELAASWDPNGADFARLRLELQKLPADEVADDLRAAPAPALQACAFATGGIGVAPYALDPFTPVQGPAVRRRLLAAQTAPWGGLFAFETGRFGGPITVVVYRGDGVRVWTVAQYALVASATSQTMPGALRSATLWAGDAPSPVSRPRERAAAMVAIREWVAGGAVPRSVMGRSLRASPMLAFPAWPDPDVQPVVWRSGPVSEAAEPEIPARSYAPPTRGKVQDCEPTFEIREPFAPQHPHDIPRCEVREVLCDSGCAQTPVFKLLLESFPKSHARILRRVCELPRAARETLGYWFGGETPRSVADYDQMFCGGCVCWHDIPRLQLVAARATPRGGWLCVRGGGLHSSNEIYVYGARGDRMTWVAALAPESDDLAGVLQRMSTAELTPEGRLETQPLLPHVAAAIEAFLLRHAPPRGYLVPIATR